MASIHFPPRFVHVHDPSSDSEVRASYRHRPITGRRGRSRRQLVELTRLEQRLRGRPGSRRHRRYMNDMYLSDQDYSATDGSSDEGVAACRNWKASFTEVGADFFAGEAPAAAPRAADRTRRRHNRLRKLLSKAAATEDARYASASSCSSDEEDEEEDAQTPFPGEALAKNPRWEAAACLFMRIDRRARALLRRGGKDRVLLEELEQLLVPFKRLTPEYQVSTTEVGCYVLSKDYASRTLGGGGGNGGEGDGGGGSAGGDGDEDDDNDDDGRGKNLGEDWVIVPPSSTTISSFTSTATCTSSTSASSNSSTSTTFSNATPTKRKEGEKKRRRQSSERKDDHDDNDSDANAGSPEQATHRINPIHSINPKLRTPLPFSLPALPADPSITLGKRFRNFHVLRLPTSTTPTVKAPPQKTRKGRAKKTKSSPFKPDALVLLFPDSFFRLLGHAVCHFHGLQSRSVTDDKGRRVMVVRRTVSDGDDDRVHGLSLCEFLEHTYPSRFK